MARSIRDMHHFSNISAGKCLLKTNPITRKNPSNRSPSLTVEPTQTATRAIKHRDPQLCTACDVPSRVSLQYWAEPTMRSRGSGGPVRRFSLSSTRRGARLRFRYQSHNAKSYFAQVTHCNSRIKCSLRMARTNPTDDITVAHPHEACAESASSFSHILGWSAGVD